MAEGQKASKTVKTVIGILLALLVLSTAVLIARVVYLRFYTGGATVVVPDNLIGESLKDPTAGGWEETNAPQAAPTGPVPAETKPASAPGNPDSREAAVIELYRGRPEDNRPFQVAGMLPGDSQTRYYAVRVSHSDDAEVRFCGEVTARSKALADILHIKVTRLENNHVLYDGPFAQLDTDGYSEIFTAESKTQTTAYYQIQVSLPPEAGNAYQQASLAADFHWSVRDTGALEPPQTGSPGIWGYAAVMAVSLAAVLVLLFAGRRKKEVA